MQRTTPQIRLPYPHPGQQAVRRQARRFNWLSAGRRWRKTTLAMSIAVETALQGKAVMWGAPVYDQVRIAWNESQHAAAGVASFFASRMEAIFPTGGRILYRSLENPENVRGHTADGIVIDEVGDVKAEAWVEVLRPTLIDTGGWLWAIGTPRGHNWFWHEWVATMDKTDSMAWQVPTLGVRVTDRGLERAPHPFENPNIPFSEIEMLWREMPATLFEQEILAQFVEGAGQVFRNVRACVDPALSAARWTPDMRCYGGLDWAQMIDFTVVAIVDHAGRLVDLDRFNQIDWATQYGRVATMTARWRLARGLAELNSIGSPNLERLQRDGLHQWVGFETTNETKAQVVQALALAFERGEIHIPNDPVLIAELEAFEAERLPSGRWRYGAPAGMHDDTVIALALAWWQRQGASGPVAVREEPEGRWGGLREGEAQGAGRWKL